MNLAAIGSPAFATSGTCLPLIRSGSYPAAMVRHIYHFRACRIDLASRELHREDRPVTASPTVFDCIAYLLEHRDRAVGRDELVAAVWGRTAVTDAVLSKTMLKARRAVGDTGDDQNVIRTVPRFGFHWVAEVREGFIEVAPFKQVAIDPFSNDPLTEPLRRDALKVWARQNVVKCALGMCSLVVLVVAIVVGRGNGGDIHVDQRAPRARTAGVDDSVGRLAVLPVAVSAAPTDAWLRLGLMDLMSHHLRDGGIAVVPSESVVRVVNQERVLDDGALRAAIGAGSLVASTLRKVDTTYLLHMEVTDIKGGRRELEVSGADPLVVAREAANRLLAILGKPVQMDPATVSDLSLIELVQRIEASMLVGDVAAARLLIETATPEQQALPELRLRSAQVDYWSGHFEIAYEKLTALRAAVGPGFDFALRARTLSNLGSSARHLGDWAAAGSAFDEAIALMDGRDDPVRLGQLYIARGINYSEQGQYSEAIDDFSLARTVFQSAGDEFQLTMVEYCEAFIENHRHRPLAALAIFEKVARRFEEFGAITEQASARSNQIATEHDLLRHLDALATSERGLPLLEQLQHQLAREQVRMSRATALASVGRLEEARSLFAELANNLNTAEEARSLGMIRVEQAYVELQAGDAKAAYAMAWPVREVAAGADAVPIRARAWLIVVQSLAQMARVDEARVQAEQFVAWADTLGDETAALYSRAAEADATRAGGEYNAALSLYAIAMRLAERNAVPIDLAMIAIPYARALIAAGDLQRAGTVAGRISRYAEQDFGSALLQVELYHEMDEVEAWRAALEHARALAGERSISGKLKVPPRPVMKLPGEIISATH